ncbi:MAG: hypothetical protein FJX46_13140 [Alphaproteobacteria bacterium]|nr:hypothetical protein [Alphaproteobacteria bacterium]
MTERPSASFENSQILIEAKTAGEFAPEATVRVRGDGWTTPRDQRVVLDRAPGPVYLVPAAKPREGLMAVAAEMQRRLAPALGCRDASGFLGPKAAQECASARPAEEHERIRGLGEDLHRYRLEADALKSLSARERRDHADFLASVPLACHAADQFEILHRQNPRSRRIGGPMLDEALWATQNRFACISESRHDVAAQCLAFVDSTAAELSQRATSRALKTDVGDANYAETFGLAMTCSRKAAKHIGRLERIDDRQTCSILIGDGRLATLQALRHVGQNGYARLADLPPPETHCETMLGRIRALLEGAKDRSRS